MHGLLEYVFTALVLHLIFKHLKRWSDEGPSPNCMEDRGPPPMLTSKLSPPSGAQCEDMHYYVGKRCVFSSALITKCTSQCLEHCNVVICTNNFLSGWEINHCAPLGIPGTLSHNVSAEGWFWSSSLKIQHNVIPCCIVLFWCQNSGTSFHHQPQYSIGSNCPQQHVTEVSAMTHPHMPFCTNPSAAGISNDNKLPSILKYL
jgi:hypothetical protein